MMKYLKLLLHIKQPSSAMLLDIALILSIIPHLFVMKFAMILYVVISLIFIVKQKKSSQYFLMAIGFVAIGVTFFNNYNFSSFSKMQFFVSFVSSLLIYAISLQRLSRITNFYIQISPMLLMLLAFFFFNTITMLIYALVVLYVFVLLMIWSRMKTTLLHVIKLNTQLFIISLPMVALLFMVFPRISFEKAQFGFSADQYSISGYDGKMSVTSNEVRLSGKIVMEVYFKDENISSSELYFRGSTLYNYNSMQWKKSSFKSKERLQSRGKIVEYDVVLYPHSNSWIYALDIPISSIKDATLNFDYTITSKKPIIDIKRYRLKSALEHNIYAKDLTEALKVDELESKKTYEKLKGIKLQDVDSYKKAQMLVSFFKNQELKYSLKPTNIDTSDFLDSFLFEAKNGYCVHFSSAFAQSARLLGIPSRVVTGFKANKKNMFKNYLIVKESDAHAWVELYLGKRGWVRFDPTTTALYENSSQTLTQNTQSSESKTTLFQRANLYYMYVKYIINSWVLNYDRLKQMKILDDLLNDTIYLLKFILSFLLLVVVSMTLFFVIRSSTCRDELECEMRKVLKILKKRNLIKSNSESMDSFLIKSQSELGVSLQNINELYHKIKYSNENIDIKSLKNEIKRFSDIMH
ncbi:MAG: transglutaminaseTgpA domain-containing protein [Campylobacterota bacterium]|nr:transglutaminaseTgpA domain-containing protein [Campylobacterota bacterium]